METPSSSSSSTISTTIKRNGVTTRSQANKGSSSWSTNSSIIISGQKDEESSRDMAFVSKRQRNVKVDRSALIDITNDSPIVGLAMGGRGRGGGGTPPPPAVGSVFKNNNKKKKKGEETPGYGEALLRSQVKMLLQKVGGNANAGGPLVGLIVNSSSPSSSGLVAAPTPTNTPEVEVEVVVVPSPLTPTATNNLWYINNNNRMFHQYRSTSVMENEYEIPHHHHHHQEEEQQEEETLPLTNGEAEKSDVTRALLFDLFEKSDDDDDISDFWCSSSSDASSVWSIQVNTSMCDDDDEEEDNNECGFVDEICDGLDKIFVQKKNNRLADDDVQGKRDQDIILQVQGDV